MTAWVMDSSVLIEVCAGTVIGQRILSDVVAGAAGNTISMVTPGDADVEVAGVFAALARKGRITAEQADRALAVLASLPLSREMPAELTPSAWRYRHNIRLADAFFAALADRDGSTLATCDAKLAAACGQQGAWPIRLYPTTVT